MPADFCECKYPVTLRDSEQRLVGDPCTRYGRSENQNAGFVIGGSHTGSVLSLQGRKHLRDLVLYEINLEDFTDEYRGGRAPLGAARNAASLGLLVYLIKVIAKTTYRGVVDAQGH